MSEPVREVSKLWGEAAARFGELLRTDPSQSLTERWQHLAQQRPDVAGSDFAFMPSLLEHQWAVVAVPADGVIYTVGLSYHFDHPELLLHAPALLKDEALLPGMQAVLNQLGRRVRDGERIGPGQRVSVGGMEFEFGPYRDADFDHAPCAYLGGFSELFQDMVHTQAGTMPVLWCSTRPAAALKKVKVKAKAKAKAKPKKKAANRKPAGRKAKVNARSKHPKKRSRR